MNAARWERIAELYDSVCQLPPAERDAFLDHVCAGDDDLRGELNSLLRQQVTRDGMLEQVARDARPWNPVGVPRSLPASIGRYRILRMIGEGGMGDVYEAEQEQPRRTVALKVVKPGLTAPEMNHRFERESQALGRLQHPGIAQIYEAGVAQTTAGAQPYFAMEFIRGSSLLDYVRSRQFDTRQKLELMCQVCEAANHAHQRGIIHRDLKPGNILVDESGHPKILDFGVAHMTDNDPHMTLRTDPGELVGTLAYMSPEQVLADPAELDARSDVYSLGVVLYEILAGRLPYQVGRKVYQAAQAIRDSEPAPLGSTNRAFRGDLEIITRKALEKDKTRRYATAADLAADLRSFLSGRPILARPPSLGYQARKFAGRHKAWTAALIAVMLVLVAGALINAREALRANRAERAALLDRDRAAAAERAAVQERDRALRAEAAATAERNRALDQTRRADTEAAAAKAVNDFLQNDLLAQAGAATQATPNNKPDPALTVRAALDRAAARIDGKFPAQPLVEAAIRQTLASTYQDLGLFPPALEQIERAVDLRRRVLGPEHPDTVSALYDQASIYGLSGKFAAAEALYEKILPLRRRLNGDRHPATLALMSSMANAALGLGQHERAEAILFQALRAAPGVLRDDDPAMLTMLNSLAVAYSNQGKYPQAEEVYKKVVSARQRVLGAAHPATLTSMDSLAVALRYQGKNQEGEVLLSKALEIRQRILPEGHPDTLAGMNSLALAYRAESRYAEAESMLAAVLAGRLSALGEEHLYTLRTMHNLAELYQMEGKTQEAESLFQKTLDIRRRVMGPGHLETVISMASLGALKLAQRQFADAQPLLREALQGFEKAGPNSWRRYHTASMLGASLAGLQAYAEAEPLLLSGYRGMVERSQTIPFDNRGELDQARQWIVRAYESWGKPESAVPWRTATATR